MVDIEEVPAATADEENVVVEEVLASEERRLDAEAIEQAASQMSRVSAKMHMEALAKKLRKESEALARMEASRRRQVDSAAANASTENEEKMENKSKAEAAAPAPGDATIGVDSSNKPAVVPASPPLPPVAASSSTYYTPIDKFSFDAGGYNDKFVTLYVDLPGVGSLPRDQITCEFTAKSFDLIVKDTKNNKTYRLFKKDNLEHDIDAEKSKIIVKSQRILVKLHKMKQKGEYSTGYDYWTKLLDNKKKIKADDKKENPQASIMQLMKEMYDEGDDNMKKIIGETMMKQQRGELGNGKGGMSGDGIGGMGGMDDFM